jgi:hypothetical protein
VAAATRFDANREQASDPRAYGVVTAKPWPCSRRFSWGFHNAKSGVCFPSYERIAYRSPSGVARCAMSSVTETRHPPSQHAAARR